MWTAVKILEWLRNSTPPFDLWKCLLTVFLVANLKNLPLVFHVSSTRLFSTLSWVLI
jgi:hypothetical protein